MASGFCKVGRGRCLFSKALFRSDCNAGEDFGTTAASKTRQRNAGPRAWDRRCQRNDILRDGDEDRALRYRESNLASDGSERLFRKRFGAVDELVQGSRG